MRASVSTFLSASARPERGGGHEQVHRVVRAQRGVDDAVRLGLERQHVLAVLGPAGGLGLVQRPLVDAEEGLPRLLLCLAAELHALGEDDLLLRGEQRHPADLPQVEANGIVGVEDLGGSDLRLGILHGDGRHDGLRLHGDLRDEGGSLELGRERVELDRRDGECGFGLGDRGSGFVRDHGAPVTGRA